MNKILREYLEELASENYEKHPEWYGEKERFIRDYLSIVTTKYKEYRKEEINKGGPDFLKEIKRINLLDAARTLFDFQ